MGESTQVIAIDGPVAAGKTTVGRELARRLGLNYLDTGVMYRAITWLALRRKVSIVDEAGLGRLAQESTMRLAGQDSSTVLVSGERVGPELWEPKVVRNVSQVAQVPEVRRALVEQQRALAAEGGMVMVGRDIGTVVLPDADLKLFITASAEVRARRRWQELQDQGQDPDFDQVLQETRDRDRIDSQRADSPLILAEDAVLIETDELSAEQVTDLIIQQVRDRVQKQTQQNSRSGQE